MHILLFKMTSNSSKINLYFYFYFCLSRDHLEACSSWIWRPVQKILKLGKIYHIWMILSLKPYSLSPKIKPILTVYANVSKLPPFLPVPFSALIWQTFSFWALSSAKYEFILRSRYVSSYNFKYYHRIFSLRIRMTTSIKAKLWNGRINKH